MDKKTLQVLEYQKILGRLSEYCDFSASKKLALAIRPSSDLEESRTLIAETSEARFLLSSHDLTIGGSHDIRAAADLAAHGGTLEPGSLLDIKSTLIACRGLKKNLSEAADKAPRLAKIAVGLPEPRGLVSAITKVLSENGEVLDSASQKLTSIRREQKASHERLMSKMQKYITDSKTVALLQEAIITQRDGRYVIPLRSEFKGRIKSVVHDQSSSGATLFVEPLAVVELNNQQRELKLAERDEIRRVLTALSAQVGEQVEELTIGIEALALLDLTFAKAKYADDINASEPILYEIKEIRHQTADKNTKKAQSEISSQKSLSLLQARHPLLDPGSVVPIDVALKPDIQALVITGPNTGGKTVSLKTIGLLALMAQSGFHIPAQSGSELPCFKNIWADIGDEQSIEQSLSTFSGHITNIIRILKKADKFSLVILDELGSGTDPVEGAALARAILSNLLERGITTFVATHYPELKIYAHATQGVVNASMEFDLKTLRPTYKLTIGLPGRSNALAIASRLGLNQEIVSAAKSDIDPSELRADKLLDDIRKERNRTGRERQKTAKARIKTEQINLELEERLEAIEDERREVLAQARAEGELEVAILKKNIEAIKAQLKNARQPLAALKNLDKKVEEIEEQVEAPVERKETRRQNLQASILERPLALGEKVSVGSLNAVGVVTALSESEAEIQVGNLRIRAKLSELERSSEAEIPNESQRSGGSQPSSIPKAKSPGTELSLRGQAADDALDMLDRYLDQAYAAGLPYVRIIHGKGTGKLRKMVREVLREYSFVTSFEGGGPKEGGEGVTVVKLN